jgi:nitrite reductase/ring-hydroxylating ferredoxin subunit
MLHLYLTKFKLICFLVSCLFISSCKKKASASELEIPETPINISVNLNDQSNAALQSNGGFKVITFESKHFLLVRKNSTSFWASACDCSANVHNGNTSVLNYVVDQSKLKDNTCGSEFDAQSGAVIKAPASAPLTTYKAILEGSIVRITR